MAIEVNLQIFRQKITVSLNILSRYILWMCERFWMVWKMLFIFIILICCVSSTFLYDNCWLLLFDILCLNTGFICFKLCDMNSCIFGYMLRSCHQCAQLVVDSKNVVVYQFKMFHGVSITLINISTFETQNFKILQNKEGYFTFVPYNIHNGRKMNLRTFE